jgi:hypothetical protein
MANLGIVVTENFSGRKLSYCAPWRANRQVVVTGTYEPDVALNNCGFTINQSWSATFPSLKCSGPTITAQPGPQHFVIDVPFEQPPGGVFPDPTLDPLNQPERISWQPCEISLPVDIDLSGRPIINAAGDPFSPPSRRVTFKRFRAIRNEPFYDVAKSNAFENTVNKAAMTVLGYSVAAEHMRCCVITPGVQDYLPTAEYLPIVYEFEIVFGDALGKYPFQHRFFNQGIHGWANDTGNGNTPKLWQFSDGVNTLVGKEIPLDLDGKPYSSDFSYVRVSDRNFSPVPRPTPANFYQTELLSVPTNPPKTTGYAVYFEACKLADHTLLAL